MVKRTEINSHIYWYSCENFEIELPALLQKRQFFLVAGLNLSLILMNIREMLDYIEEEINRKN